MVDHLDVISPQFVIGLWLLAGFAVLLTARALRRRGGRWPLRFAALGLTSVLCVALASADLVNVHFAYLPTVGDVRNALTGDRQWLKVDKLVALPRSAEHRALTRGAVVRVTIRADRRDGFGETTAVAYLPPQYFQNPLARLPVVYLLHGSPGRPGDWFHAGKAASLGLATARSGNPAILFAPQLSRSWTDDPECVNGVKEKVESYLLQRVIPTVDATFRTLATRTGRTFAGMSAGGYCALNLALRNRNVAATIIDMSGYTKPTHTGGARVLFGRHNPAVQQLIAANSPATYAATLPPSPPTRVWLDAGDDDKQVVREMTTIAKVLASRGIHVAWRVRDGGHTYRVWTAALAESLPWALAGQPARAPKNPSRPGP